ncbi:MAG: AraC family transcriptional regulator ligand-binding domain-containing protein [Roseovarius confluentis]
MTRPFVIDLGWSALLGELGVRPADLLRSAGLAEDLFARDRPTVTPEGFRNLFDALAKAIGHEAPGLIVGQAMSPEVFSPPLFAAYCCENLAAATRRLSQYKPLIGPLKLESHSMAGGLELTFDAEPGVDLPDEYVAAELVFLVNLARRATRHAVRPVAVEMVRPPRHKGYFEFFGHPVYPGPFNRVVFAPEDARRPFLSANPALFRVFDPELQARLDELDRNASVADRVRSALMEALPGGQPDVGTVARRLGMSSRTLQRRLGAEGTGFQDVLRELRERLARDYLRKTAHTSAEISFLLGYEDPNSFTRAFHLWTGTTPEAHRAEA